MKDAPQTPAEVNDDDKKNFIIKEVLFWFYHTFVVIVAALLIAYAIKSQQEVLNIQQLDQYARAMETIDFWGKGYIIDIKAVSTMNCPQGYDSLINYQWDGTTEGCNCPTMLNNYYYEYILQGVCSADLIQNGCQRIPPISQEQMNFWKGGKLLCIRRIKSLTFYNSTYPTSTTGCSVGQPQQVQTYLNISCPITVASNQSLGTGQTSLLLNSTSMQSLQYMTQSGYPIADFKLTQYDFCPVYSQKNISPDKTGNYILEPNNITTCNGMDPRITVVDTIDEESLFNNNVSMSLLIADVKTDIGQLPSYPRPSNVYTYQLGFVRYPTWTYACRTNPNLNLTVVTSHLKLQQETYIAKLVFAFTLGLAITYGFLLRMFYMIRRAKELKGKSAYGRIYENERELAKKVPNLNYIHNPKLEVFWIVVDMLLTVGLLAVYLIVVVRFSAISLWYKSVFQNNCTDSFLALILQNYEMALDKCYYDLVVCIVLSLLVILFHVLFLIFRCIGGDLKPQDRLVLDTESVSQDDANRLMAINGDSIVLKDKDLKMELDFQMDDGLERETKDNFYNIYAAEADLGIKKKKKKKPLKKRNLFKKDDQIEEVKFPE